MTGFGAFQTGPNHLCQATQLQVPLIDATNGQDTLRLVHGDLDVDLRGPWSPMRKLAELEADDVR